jgi:hypothetical protein
MALPLITAAVFTLAAPPMPVSVDVLCLTFVPLMTASCIAAKLVGRAPGAGGVMAFAVVSPCVTGLAEMPREVGPITPNEANAAVRRVAAADPMEPEGVARELWDKGVAALTRFFKLKAAAFVLAAGGRSSPIAFAVFLSITPAELCKVG